MKTFQRTESHLCVLAVEYWEEGGSLCIKQETRIARFWGSASGNFFVRTGSVLEEHSVENFVSVLLANILLPAN